MHLFKILTVFLLSSILQIFCKLCILDNRTNGNATTICRNITRYYPGSISAPRSNRMSTTCPNGAPSTATIFTSDSGYEVFTYNNATWEPHCKTTEAGTYNSSTTEIKFVIPAGILGIRLNIVQYAN